MDISSCLLIAIEAALKAGKQIMEIYTHADLSIQTKVDNSPVTLADFESSDIICSCLKKTGFPVISEENAIPEYSIRKNWEYFWLVDPLDGTKEFIKRNGEFTVNIALIDHNVPVLGIVLIPAQKTIYYAVKGKGAWKNENVSFTGDVANLIQTAKEIKSASEGGVPAIIVSRSHHSNETTDFIWKVENRYGKPEMLTSGSTIKLCLIAEGKADIYPRYGTTMEWDTAAGEVIAGQFGIGLFSRNGLPLQYNKPDLKNPSFIAYNPVRFQLADIF
jgi:3'(2'), 5'-bisphosphate nucleotidase